MPPTQVETRYTPEQYLAFERAALGKHEYVDGLIVAMARSKRWHNLITGNLLGEINAQLRHRPGEVYASNMRILVGPTGFYTYPDVVAVSEKSKVEDGHRDTLLNPTVLFEVFSPLTEARDRGMKFTHYRPLESLREYVLVAQDYVLVERYTRQGDEWLLTELSRLEDTLRLESIGCAVALSEIYRNVEFAADADNG
jgi:Uma2 family endonuclease